MCMRRVGSRRHQKEDNDAGVAARYRRGRKRVGPRVVGAEEVEEGRREFKRDRG
jgi:hypothetical protein